MNLRRAVASANSKVHLALSGMLLRDPYVVRPCMQDASATRIGQCQEMHIGPLTFFISRRSYSKDCLTF